MFREDRFPLHGIGYKKVSVFLKGEAEMSQQHLETVKRLFDAVRRRDQAGVLEAYHPEIVIHESPSLPY
jgi:hypothetical protein